jgi:hypothetical protein
VNEMSGMAVEAESISRSFGPARTNGMYRAICSRISERMSTHYAPQNPPLGVVCSSHSRTTVLSILSGYPLPGHGMRFLAIRLSRISWMSSRPGVHAVAVKLARHA